MTNYNPSFSPSEFELRNYTSAWLSPDQKTAVDLTESRVNSQLDFLAQMLGWSGPNYWTNLPDTVNEKRQILSGTFGVYNSYVIPEIYEYRNWDNSVVVDRVPFVKTGQIVYIESVELGREEYQILDIKTENEKYVLFLEPLPDSFYQQIANGTPLKIDIASARPAPFYRPEVGVSGDADFLCSASGSTLMLHPAWDSSKKFTYKFPILFAGSTYSFNQPLYLEIDNSSQPIIESTYNQDSQAWFLSIPASLVSGDSGLEAILVWPFAGNSTTTPASLSIKIQSWQDPSDWGNKRILDNFWGTWGNKGGSLPFDFSFDALSIHGFNELNSIYFENVTCNLQFNDIVKRVYAQQSIVDVTTPGKPQFDQFWWNENQGYLSYWQNDFNACSPWVEINYRNLPNSLSSAPAVFPDVTAFNLAASTLPVGTLVQITDITGLGIAENVLGVQGTLTRPGTLLLYRATDSVYWTPAEFKYATVADFSADAELLPYKVPVRIFDSSGLLPISASYSIQNLSITVTGNYETVLTKYYTNKNWQLSADSQLRYIADSSLFGTYQSGEMWWDFANPLPETRAAAIYVSSASPIATLAILNPGKGLTNGIQTNVPLIAKNYGSGTGVTADITVAAGIVTSVTVNNPGNYYKQGDILVPDSSLFPQLVGCEFTVSAATADSWVSVNSQAASGPIAPTLHMGVILFYCEGQLLVDGQTLATENYNITYSTDSPTGTYTIDYQPKTFLGKTQLPAITISDSLTTAYTSDITELVFGGKNYYMSPNVFDAESPLRLWKSQDLQCAETVAHLAEENYINPLLADLNNGPGSENWERYFVRMPLDYGRNQLDWQKTALICQDFGYWGSSINPERMNCPPGESLPVVYEELFLYGGPIPDYTYVYSEPYLYSNIGYYNLTSSDYYENVGIFPTFDVKFDEFEEAKLVDYEPLHFRQADVVSPVNDGYGDWLGIYVNVNPCVESEGYLVNDLSTGAVSPVLPPVWDASIYKFAPTCDNDPESFSVDANHYKIGYAYFVADASAAEDGFFDIQQEAAWRYPVNQPKTLYLTH